MKHIHKTELSTYNVKLDELGVKSHQWFEFNVVLSKVSGWRESTNEDTDIIESECSIYLEGDDPFTIKTPYKEFDRIMNEYLQLKN